LDLLDERLRFWDLLDERLWLLDFDLDADFDSWLAMSPPAALAL
jgi:hypothetical protein